MDNAALRYGEKRIDPGLSEDEVRRALDTYGENKLSRRKRKSFLRSFLESFGDPMIKILLIALAINIIFLFQNANWFESVGIAAAIVLATLVSTISEYGSESAFERLQEEASRVNCRVRRGGRTVEIPVSQVVVGDIVLLQSGDRVPADGVILSGRLGVDQSALNGETKEAHKHVISEASGGACDPRDFSCPELLFSGSVAVSGQGFMRVTDVGDMTVYGHIGSEIQQEKRESPLKLRLGKLAGSIGRFGYIAALAVAGAYLFNVIVMDSGFDPGLMLGVVSRPAVLFRHIIKAATLAVTVIVMAVPEGLPMMITVVLSANMKRMLRDNVLVRKLVGIETAGSLNILFTDKTGTLTHGRLAVSHFISGDGTEYAASEAASIPAELRRALRDAVYYNTTSSIGSDPGSGSLRAVGGNATDRAALEFAAALPESGRRLTAVKTTPFSSETKYMTTVVEGDVSGVLVKGAPEKLLPCCTGYIGGDGKRLPGLSRRRLDAMINRLSGQAVRIIAVATGASLNAEDGLGELTLVGFLGLRDQIREEVYEGVKTVRGAGVQIVMITGDSKLTAEAVAREAGIVTGDGDLILTSQELNALPEEELSRLLPDLRVVARALPEDKSRLVRAAQGRKLVVGMTGDGVNDAPALKQADVGFAMGSGTEVAKEAGDIVILDDNFASISKAVCYGRTVFKSIRKFVIYQLSICMCAVGVTVVGPLVGVDFPITVIQMLWINIVMDTLAGLAFSGEIARRKYMEEPPKSREEPIINGYMLGQIAVNSIYSTLLCLFFLKSPAVYKAFGGGDHVYMMTAFFALFMFLAIFQSFSARTHQINLLDYLSANKPFIWIMSSVTVIQIYIIYLGGMVFRTAGLRIRDLCVVILLAFTIMPVDMIRRLVLSYLAKKNIGRGYNAGT